MEKCVVCGAHLAGRQSVYCSNACKQALKYRVSKGEACRHCKKPMKPKPIPGGYDAQCDRKRCIKSRA